MIGLELLFKMGTAASGNRGHSGRPGKRGGSVASGKRKPSAARLGLAREMGFSFTGKLDESAYSKLSAADKVKALKKEIKNYKEQYVPKVKQKRAISKLSTKNKKKWLDSNKRIGALEGMRRAMLTRGDKTSRVEQRKYYHFSIKLGENAMNVKSSMKELK